MQKSMTASRSILMAFVAIALAVVCAFGFAACNKDGDDKKADDTAKNVTARVINYDDNGTAKESVNALTIKKAQDVSGDFNYVVTGKANKAKGANSDEGVVKGGYYLGLTLGLGDAWTAIKTALDAQAADKLIKDDGYTLNGSAYTFTKKGEDSAAAFVNEINTKLTLDKDAKDLDAMQKITFTYQQKANKDATTYETKTIVWVFDLRNVTFEA